SFVKPVNVKSGEYADTKDSDIVVISAGAGQKPGETRLDLINKNYKIMGSIVSEVVKYSPNSILLVVSNPVDILTYIVYKLSGFPKERVIGSGTVLDTARFKYLLSSKLGIDAKNIHNAYIMGEHGDSEIATWSHSTIAGMPMDKFAKTYADKNLNIIDNDILQQVRNAAYEIIKRKGATYYAIALSITKIVETILRDENGILPVSTLLQGQYGISDIYLGTPCIVGRSGVKAVIETELDDNELKALHTSAKTLKESLKTVE
ncbi:MAG: L-lactate dehydrogenase, partial [Clostridium sp.]|nr:L-lactate dehydrogenase [Clostridium sp.]